MFIDFYGFIDFGHGFLSTWRGLKIGPAAPLESFARFQAGFLSPEDFHRFLYWKILTDIFSMIFMSFIDFQ